MYETRYKGVVPLPSRSPVEFLHKFLHQIPPHLITSFASVTTPKERSLIPEVRNRRLRYTETAPKQLELESAKARWPYLWSGREQYGKRAAEDEKEWASKNFLDGMPQQVGKLGSLLGEYEEEREAERRHGRMQQTMPESPEELRTDFERRIKELFIYGLLEGADYDLCDWSEQYDIYDEEGWFNEEEADEMDGDLEEGEYDY
ncbi:hypothetical protein EDC04DRAFT_2876475 [Pisolithus marmoratus]|nr:hypothetical protein EDC04DRAFT_2876475 [Pisolithus marmoratus]